METFELGDVGKKFVITAKNAKEESTQKYWGKENEWTSILLTFLGANVKNKTHHFIFKASDSYSKQKFSISKNMKTLYRCGYCKIGEIIDIKKIY